MPLLKQLQKERPVILVRHAETAMNEEDVARGWTDVPLDKDTYSHLKSVGKELKKQGVQGIFSCNLLRTLQTSRCLSQGGDIPILGTGEWLRTWNVGKYTGKPAKTVDPIIEQIAIEEPCKTIEGGESFEEFKYRYLLGLVGCLNQHPGKLLSFTTHGRNLATLNAWAFMDYNESLELDTDYLGYEEYEPGSAHLFVVSSPLLI